METLGSFYATERQLEQAVQAFSASCETLSDALSAGLGDTILQGVLVTSIRSRLNHIEDIHYILETCRNSLKALSNVSPAITPVKHLPPEILSRIFTYAIRDYCGYYYRSSEDPLVVISSVCTYWRHVAIQTKSLWSHVDLSPSPRFSRFDFTVKLANLWLERSKDCPIHVHFGSEPYGSYKYAPGISQAASTLSPHIARVSSLTFQSECSSYLIKAIFELYETSNVSGILSSLFMENVRSPDLELGERRLQWSGQFLHGFVNLQLNRVGPEGIGPDFDQLFAILLSSPALRMLQLRGLHPPQIEDTSEYPMLAFPHLRFLDLRDMDSVWLIHLLPKISSTGSDLHFEMDVSPDQRVAVTAASFIARTPITSLGLWQKPHTDDLPILQYLSSSKQLRVLLVSLGYNGIKQTLNALVLHTEHGPIPRFPTLETLVLIRFRIDIQEERQIKDVVYMHDLHAVGFSDFSSSVDYELEDEDFFNNGWSQVENIAPELVNDADEMEGYWAEFVQHTLLGRRHWDI